MIKIICDKCKKEIEKKLSNWIKTTIVESPKYEIEHTAFGDFSKLVPKSTFSESDHVLCDNCYKLFQNWILGKDTKEAKNEKQ